MRVFIDFEFVEDGHTIDPLSVGMVADDGREYYAVFNGSSHGPQYGALPEALVAPEWTVQQIADFQANLERVTSEPASRHQLSVLPPGPGPVHIAAAIANPWLRENVLPHLPVRVLDVQRCEWEWDRQHPDADAIKPRTQIADEVLGFFQAAPKARTWAWYGAYDHVALAQIFGPMRDLPDAVPMWISDLKQEAVRLGNPRVPSQDPATVHHALHDARHDRDIARYLDQLTQQVVTVDVHGQMVSDQVIDSLRSRLKPT